jgi:hypothetical protein
MQAALFGANRIFTPSAATTPSIADQALLIQQRDSNSVRLDAQGTVTLAFGLSRSGFGPIVIEENITSQFAGAFGYANWLLDYIDPTQRLTHLAIVATLAGAENVVWRTQAEQNASPTSYSMGMRSPERRPVHLTPPQRPRPSLKLNPQHLIEDFVTLLRREWKS